MKNLKWLGLLFLMFILNEAEAGIENRPLNTDDALTLDKGTGTVAVGGVFLHADNDDDRVDFPINLDYGFTENFEISVDIPFSYFNPEAGSSHGGLADVSFRPELNFLSETEILPALSFATVFKLKNGDEDRSLGSGAVDYKLSLQATKTVAPFTFHFNIGYIFTGESADSNLDDVVFYNFAAQYDLSPVLILVGEIVGQTNSDPIASNDPLEWLLGFMYSPKENYILDAGIGAGFNDASPDLRATMGITYSF